jgi:hypothetical protein
MFGMMKERDLSLWEDIESSKLQVPIPKDQELGNPTTSRYTMTNRRSNSTKDERVPKEKLEMD